MRFDRVKKISPRFLCKIFLELIKSGIWRQVESFFFLKNLKIIRHFSNYPGNFPPTFKSTAETVNISDSLNPSSQLSGDGSLKLTARPGHLVYCFGDIDSRYCRGLSGSAGSDYIMKQIWLEFNSKRWSEAYFSLCVELTRIKKQFSYSS